MKVDVRILAATNRDLSEEVAEGRFREDLYYRLNVVAVTLPPLRARRDDIPILVRHFLAELARENGREIPSITREAMEILQAYHWPGNVRELRNIMENTFVFLHGNTIAPENLPPGIGRRRATSQAPTPAQTGTGSAAPSEDSITLALGLPLEEVETTYLKRTLEECDGNRTKAAEVLQISRRTLQRRIKELGLEG